MRYTNSARLTTRSDQRSTARLVDASHFGASIGRICPCMVKWKPPKPYRELIYEALLQASPQYRMTLSQIVGYITTTYDDCRDRRSKIDSNF